MFCGIIACPVADFGSILVSRTSIIEIINNRNWNYKIIFTKFVNYKIMIIFANK